MIPGWGTKGPHAARALVHPQSCLTLCDPMGGSLPGSSVHGTILARILEWVVISSSRGSSPPRDRTWVSCVSCTGGWQVDSLAGGLFTASATWEARGFPSPFDKVYKVGLFLPSSFCGSFSFWACMGLLITKEILEKAHLLCK